MALTFVRNLLLEQIENAAPELAGLQILTLNRLVGSQRSLKPSALSVSSPECLGDHIRIFTLM